MRSCVRGRNTPYFGREKEGYLAKVTCNTIIIAIIPLFPLSLSPPHISRSAVGNDDARANEQLT